MNANYKFQKDAQMSPVQHLKTSPGEKPYSPDLFAEMEKMPPPMKTVRISIDDMPFNITQAKPQPTPPPPSNMMDELRERLKDELKYLPGEEAPPECLEEQNANTSKPSLDDHLAAFADNYRHLSKDEPDENLFPYSSALELIKASHAESELSVAAKMQAAIEDKFKKSLNDSERKNVSLIEMMSQMALNNFVIADFLQYAILDKETEKKNYATLGSLLPNKIKCENQALKMALAVKSLETLPGASLRISAGQLNMAGLQQVNDAGKNETKEL